MLRRSLPFLLLITLVVLPVFAGENEEAFLEAARGGDLETVKKLIAEGLDVNTPVNDYGATALTFACDKGQLEVVRFLVEKGADVNAKDTFYQSTPITWAIFGGHAEIAAHLVEHGAGGLEAARMAIFTENPAVAKAVVATGKLKAEELSTLLSVARERKAEEVVAALEAAGAKPPPPSEFQLPPEALAHFAGTYRIEQFDLDLTVSAGDGTLLVKNPNAEEPSPYEPLAANRFRRKGSDTEIRFDLDGEKITGFQLFQAGRDEPLQFVKKSAEAAGEATAEAAEAAPEPAAAVATEAAIPPGAAGRDWPAFRGPNAAGTGKGSPPVEWNAEEGTNILWKTAIPGRAHASPIVWGDRLFVTTAVSEKPEGEFRHGLYGDVDSVKIETSYSWRIYALDKKSGAVVWHRVAAEGMPRAAHHIKATQANSTPVTDGEHVVAVLGSEGLYCWDLDGKLLWKRDLGLVSVGWFYDASYEWGHSSSPILYKDTVIVQADRHHEPFLAAFSLADGSEVWRTARENLPSFGTPTLVESEGGPELVTNGSRLIRAYDPGTGKERWRLGPTSELTVGTPVVGHGMVFVTGGYPPVRPIYAVRPGGEGDLSLAEDAESSEHVAWKTDRGGTYMPTPLVYGDHLYMTSNAGVVTCYDAKTGERLYRERVAGKGGVAFTASPVAAGGRLYFVSEVGDGYVVKAGKKFERLATNPVGEIVMATPAISGDVLFVRSLEHVFAIGEKDEGEEPAR